MMKREQVTRRTFLQLTAAGAGPIFLSGCQGPFSHQPPHPSVPPTPAPRLSGVPGSILASTLGLNIHPGNFRPDDVERIAAAGFGYIRLDFRWAEIERQQGQYDFAALQTLVTSFAAHGIRVLAILDYGNPLYDQQTPLSNSGPQTDAVRQAFARFAAAAVTHFKGQALIWEIWNEPNNPDFWHPTPAATAYMALASRVIPAMRQVERETIIIAPSVTTYPGSLDAWTFLEQCFKLGLLEQIDAVSIHPYRQTPPETALADYQRLRKLITSHGSSAKQSLPLVSSEWGYPLTTQVTRELQAALLARQILTNALGGLALSVWYDWRDDEALGSAFQDFGLVTATSEPKPAYFAMQTLTRQLTGFRFLKSLALASPTDFAVLFEAGRQQKLVVWTAEASHTLVLPYTATIQAVDLLGGTHTLVPTSQGLTIEVTGAPLYLLVKK